MLITNKIITTIVILLACSAMSVADVLKQSQIETLTCSYTKMNYSPLNDTIMPKFTYGQDSMMRFIAKNIKYPVKAKEQNIKGTVYVSFVVDEQGNVTNTRVVKGIGGGCDEESMRVISSMPKWIPGEANGKKIATKVVIPIRFVLPPPPANTQEKK